MNLRHFSIALLISALPMVGLAEAAVTLNEGDFKAAERVDRNGETILKVKLSKSGRAKLKKLKQSSKNKDVQADLAGVSKTFELKVPVTGDGLEMGPYSLENAKKITAEINSSD